jgi:hypothetical protein
MITTSPVFDGRMTAGRKGIPYDLSQFDTPAATSPVTELHLDTVEHNTVAERVLVAA